MFDPDDYGASDVADFDTTYPDDFDYPDEAIDMEKEFQAQEAYRQSLRDNAQGLFDEARNESLRDLAAWEKNERIPDLHSDHRYPRPVIPEEMIGVIDVDLFSGGYIVWMLVRCDDGTTQVLEIGHDHQSSTWDDPGYEEDWYELHPLTEFSEPIIRLYAQYAANQTDWAETHHDIAFAGAPQTFRKLISVSAYDNQAEWVVRMLCDDDRARDFRYTKTTRLRGRERIEEESISLIRVEESKGRVLVATICPECKGEKYRPCQNCNNHYIIEIQHPEA